MFDDLVPYMVVVAMLLYVWVLAGGRKYPMTKRELERLHFRQAYSLSIDRMLSESPLDRDEVRRLRDSGRRNGRVRAVRYVKKWDPVPLEIAVEFVDRV
ncbi:hypothetical protein E4J66_12545 [Actinomyces viscosus]|uniref:Uncharacterized protein n=1 Tax=Actinomyces viscosus TaxID=1656 RepID=A0A3S4VDZ5_ACTVI|nr:hypothetical protein [Actinomyces viscosus]TFH51306.1 hypothetical protein E4J66_12545 [Actinomyces viscosus]VEI15744.1 Uncharacterised protein [Actinomyces viscosus]